MARGKLGGVAETFPERLKELMNEAGMIQADVADILNIKRQTVSLYLTGKSKPDIEQLKMLAEYFHVSSDWLLGLTDVQAIDTGVKQICNVTGLSQTSVEMLISFGPRFKNTRTAIILLDEILKGPISWYATYAWRAAWSTVHVGRQKGVDPTWTKNRDMKLLEEALHQTGNASETIELTAMEANMLFDTIARQAIEGAVNNSLAILTREVQAIAAKQQEPDTPSGKEP